MSKPQKADFAVYDTTRSNAKYTMAYICNCCGKPGTGDDKKGLFVGECGAGTNSTVMAS